MLDFKSKPAQDEIPEENTSQAEEKPVAEDVNVADEGTEIPIEIAMGEEETTEAEQPENEDINQQETMQGTIEVPVGTPIVEKQLKPKKKAGTPKANIFIVVSLILVLGAGAFGFMLLNQQDFPFVTALIESIRNTAQLPTEPEPTQPTEPEPTQPTEPEPEPIDPEEIVEYNSPNFEFALYRRAKTKLIEPGSFNTQLDTYQILYEGPGQSEELTGPENLRDGYIFTLTVHKDVLNQDINQIALEKRNRYFLSCDSSATISNITERTISNRTAKTFSVENCGVDYIQSFFLRGGDLFEFNQIYRGDLGIRQIYKNETDEIVNKFTILNTIQPTPQNTWTQYEERFMIFRHPAQLDKACCTVKGTESPTVKKLMVLADPKSLSGANNELFNGFGVFTDALKANQTIEQYIEDQRKLLVENYRVIIGKEPIVAEEVLSVGGQRAVFLRGYAWWGDIVITETPDKRNAIIFVLVEVDPGSFESIFREILTTVEF